MMWSWKGHEEPQLVGALRDASGDTHESAIHSASFDATGSLVLTASTDRTARIRN